ncbi:MAG: tetraacyldisaccharide 4'-kinase [Woeseia sp.]
MSRKSPESTFANRIWYERSSWYLPLLPLSWFFALVTAIRRFLYRSGMRRPIDVGKPVIVVGNIVSGGTGKTPVTMWLAAYLKQEGFQPGIVSRGYGGAAGDGPLQVSDDSDAGIVGDEPLLMATRSICPVVVHPDRVAAARSVAGLGCDIIIADDGLQHYRLKRAFEIAVVDGERGFGNGRLLPAGPLREPLSRLRSVDRIMLQGFRNAGAVHRGLADLGYTRFELAVTGVHALQGSKAVALDAFRDKTVHAIAAIGNPQRFFRLLESQGIRVIPHAFADHAVLSRSELEFGDDLDVLMTEKDAMKIGKPAPLHWWYVAVDLTLGTAAMPNWVTALAADLKRPS